MNISTEVGVWVTALGILSIYSILFKENRFYRIGEHIFLGITAGHFFVVAISEIRDTVWSPLFTEGRIAFAIPLILGIMLYLRFFPKTVWLSRLPMALLIGVGVGLGLRGAVDAQFVQQIISTIMAPTSINNIMIIVGVATTILYFVFTYRFENTKLSSIPRIGRLVMMMAFGAAFGNAVMGRISLVIGWFTFFLRDWLGIITM